MITKKFNYTDLYLEAVKRKTSVIRLLFDTHIYKMIDKRDFEMSSRGHNNSMVQVADLGTDHITVRVKTKGMNELIGKGN